MDGEATKKNGYEMPHKATAFHSSQWAFIYECSWRLVDPLLGEVLADSQACQLINQDRESVLYVLESLESICCLLVTFSVLGSAHSSGSTCKISKANKSHFAICFAPSQTKL